jgi:hypothetical protein
MTLAARIDPIQMQSMCRLMHFPAFPVLGISLPVLPNLALSLSSSVTYGFNDPSSGCSGLWLSKCSLSR